MGTRSASIGWTCNRCTHVFNENINVCILCSGNPVYIEYNSPTCNIDTAAITDPIMMTIDLVIDGEVVNHTEHLLYEWAEYGRDPTLI